MRVCDSGVEVWGVTGHGAAILGSREWRSGCEMEVLRCKVQGLGFSVQESGFRV